MCMQLLRLLLVSGIMALLSTPEIGSDEDAAFEEGTLQGTIILEHTTGPAVRRGRYGGRAADDRQQPDTTPVAIWLTRSGSSPALPEEEYYLLDQKDREFIPKLLVIPRGGTVRIMNSDPVYHNVFSLSSVKRFDVGRRPTGDYKDVVFDQPGIVDVFCDMHSAMHAVIVVVPDETYSRKQLEEPDAFTLDLPSGSYELNIYAVGFDQYQTSVEINEGEVTDVGTIRLN